MAWPVGTPNPGSKKARERGCTCPVLDNNRGKGIAGDGNGPWYVLGGCPLHAPSGFLEENKTGEDYDPKRHGDKK